MKEQGAKLLKYTKFTNDQKEENERLKRENEKKNRQVEALTEHRKNNQ